MSVHLYTFLDVDFTRVFYFSQTHTRDNSVSPIFRSERKNTMLDAPLPTLRGYGFNYFVQRAACTLDVLERKCASGHAGCMCLWHFAVKKNKNMFHTPPFMLRDLDFNYLFSNVQHAHPMYSNKSACGSFRTGLFRVPNELSASSFPVEPHMN